MDFLVVIHPAEEGGYWAEIPALEGCFAQGDSIEDLLDETKGAIESHLDALKREGQALPDGGPLLPATVHAGAVSAA